MLISSLTECIVQEKLKTIKINFIFIMHLILAIVFEELMIRVTSEDDRITSTEYDNIS